MLLSLLLCSFKGVAGGDVWIKNVDNFTSFANNVNKRNDYSGTTVYLDSDLSLSETTLGPIGTNLNLFNGVFDGQGHVISNLKMSTTSQYTGLFGYSTGLTIKNVVLDSSCSIESTFSSDSTSGYIGGIIGYCGKNSGECNIENNVNMVGITFSGNTGYNLYIGGVVGDIHSSSKYSAYLKNCVNYGSVTGSGTVSSFAELGGIVGYSDGSLSYNVYIQNCLNYGAITHSGTTDVLAIGGIVGSGYSSTCIENCVSAGKIVTQATALYGNYVASIIGSVKSGTHINYCYYTNDVSVSSINGYGILDSTTGTSDSPTDVDSNLVSKLNSNATSCNWNKWLLNTNKVAVTFKMNDNSGLSLSSQLILIPIPVKEGNSFLFWCKDAGCTEEFDSKTESVSGNIAIYAKWRPNNYTVAFDFDNGTTVNETFSYNTEIIYPDIKKEGHKLSWDNYHEFMPAKNITVTAQWTPNNYTVTFDFDNGTTVNETFSYNKEIIYPKNVPEKEGHTLSWVNYHELMPARDITVTAQWTTNNYTVTFDANDGEESVPASKIVTFNEKYGVLPKPKRGGFMFIGWFTNETNGVKVTNETIVTIPDNHTLYAHWEKVTAQVEIVFNKKGLTQEEVERILKQCTNADFEITKFEKSSESDELTVIIKFADKDDAEKLVEGINKSGEGDIIKQVKIVYSDDGSLSTMTYPLSFFAVLLL